MSPATSIPSLTYFLTSLSRSSGACSCEQTPDSASSRFSPDLQPLNPALIPWSSTPRTPLSIAFPLQLSHPAWKCFCHFHDQYNISFPSFDLITMTCFITRTHSAVGLKTHTIKVYLRGISFISKLITGTLGPAHGHLQITSLLRGLSCQEPAKNPSRLPLIVDFVVALYLHHRLWVWHSSHRPNPGSHVCSCLLWLFQMPSQRTP